MKRNILFKSSIILLLMLCIVVNSSSISTLAAHSETTEYGILSNRTYILTKFSNDDSPFLPGPLGEFTVLRKDEIIALWQDVMTDHNIIGIRTETLINTKGLVVGIALTKIRVE